MMKHSSKLTYEFVKTSYILYQDAARGLERPFILGWTLMLWGIARA